MLMFQAGVQARESLWSAPPRGHGMKASHRIGHQDKASTSPGESTVMLAVSRKLNIRMDRQVLACEGCAIQDLHIGTGPF